MYESHHYCVKCGRNTRHTLEPISSICRKETCRVCGHETKQEIHGCALAKYFPSKPKPTGA